MSPYHYTYFALIHYTISHLTFSPDFHRMSIREFVFRNPSVQIVLYYAIIINNMFSSKWTIYDEWLEFVFAWKSNSAMHEQLVSDVSSLVTLVTLVITVQVIKNLFTLLIRIVLNISSEFLLNMLLSYKSSVPIFILSKNLCVLL